ncbi:MAG: DUF935 family protein [Nitrospinae bacterium]|nr:DUF935 family protein [Nitrospinota bacterium]
MTILRPRSGEIIPTRPFTYWSSRSPRDLTPGRLAAILNNLDAGDAAEAMALFDEMEERDLHLGAVMQTRILSAISRDRDVIPASDKSADDKIAAFVRDVFDAIPSRQALMASLMSAVSHGFAMAEIIWDLKDGAVSIKEIAPRPQKLFTFIDYEDPARLLDFPRYLSPKNPVGVKLPREKFIFHKNHAVSSEFLKSGLYRGIAWYYLFTNFTVKDWLSFIDLYGVPMRLGKYNSTATDQARAVLKDAVANLGSDAAAVISGDTTIEFIQSNLTGSQSLFSDAVEFFNRLKSKRVLGQTLTTEPGAGSGGSYALGQVHDRVRNDIVAYDCKALDETLSHDLVRPLVDFNFGPQKSYPKIITRLAQPGDVDEKLNQIRKLVEMGAKVPARIAAEAAGVRLLGDPEEPLTMAHGTGK